MQNFKIKKKKLSLGVDVHVLFKLTKGSLYSKRTSLFADI